ncbi:MAG: hypothetical protein HQ583_02840, partial [Candidatus Abyssubacteria bacterium]|nr:hypothetical protein [Candidatus Abyssubacteria bacterium]
RIKTLLRASRAKAEWRMGGQMFGCGLPVAEPLGLGERRSGGLVTGAVLLLRALPRCVDLSAFLNRHSAFKLSSSTGPEKQDGFLESLGGLIRRMHSAGFWHPDLHTGNLLVDSGVVPPKLWLVDLHSVGRSSKISSRRRMADLAKLISSLRNLLDESQLCEVLAAYEPDATEREVKEMLSRLLKAADSIQKRRLKSRSKRCLKTSGKFVVEKVGNNKLYRRRELETEAVLDVVKRHKEIRALKGAELVKSTSKSALTTFSLTWGNEEDIYVKEFNNRGFIKLLEAVFHVHRGKRAWKTGHLLRLLKVPCAELRALVEERRFGFMRASYLIMKEIPDATRLNAFLMRNYFRISEGLSREEALQKRELIRAGALALRDFHSKKIYHKDLSAKNLLVSLAGDGRPHFYCVDTDSIEFPWRLSLRRRIKNLAQLNGLPACITTADRIRFYKEYFGLETLTPRHKLFIRGIRWLSRGRVAHSRRIDERVRKQYPLDEKTYEDIASL